MPENERGTIEKRIQDLRSKMTDLSDRAGTVETKMQEKVDTIKADQLREELKK